MIVQGRRRALLALLGAAALTAAAAPVTASAGASTSSRPLCSPAFAGGVACMGEIVTSSNGRTRSASTPEGLVAGSAPVTPARLHSAYTLPLTAPVVRTIAIVDAFDDPNAEADLATYDATYALPACTTANGCFRKVNQNGQSAPLPRYDGGWATEISLDVQVAHAVCQNCKIVLVEAISSSMLDLARAENSAAAMGANVISNSWGGSEFSSYQNPAFNHPGIVITASSGDSGFGTSYPAADSHVVAVGGTRVTFDGLGRLKSETAWEGSGSGCSPYVQAQPFQTSVPNWASTGCGSRRAIADVSAVAAPDTGVAIRFTPPGGVGAWYQIGGTSLSAPLIGAVFALAANTSSVAYPAQLLYQNRTALSDVVAGSNGSCAAAVMCHAGPGYDGPSGLGVPFGLGAF